MSPVVAAMIFALVIIGLFMLDRDPNLRVSHTLWVPVIWVSLGSSRMVSQWLNITVVTESPDQYLEGSPLDRIIISFLIVLGLIILGMRARRSKDLLRINGPIVVFIAYCFLSVFWSDYPEVAFKRWVKFFGNLVMILVVLTDPNPSTAIKRFLVNTGFVLIPLSVLLIKYFPEFGRGYNPWTYTTYYSGVSDTKNGLGVICLVFGLGFLWCFLNQLFYGDKSRRTRLLIAYGTVLGMTLWLFWKADSATSLGCFVLIGSGLIILTRKRGLAHNQKVMNLMIGAGILFVVLALVIFDSGETLVGLLGRDTTLTGRTELWGQLSRMHTAPWFGTGFESFFLGDRLKELWTRYWWRPNQAHNGYLEIYLNLGWMGVALFSSVLARGYMNVLKSLKLNTELGTLRFALFAVAVLYNMTEAGVKVMHPAWIALLLAVVVVPDHYRNEGGKVIQ